MKKNFQFADRLNVQNKTVLLRLDVNVPTNAGVVTDDTRIRRIIPGILSLIDAGAKIVVLTHFGRPKGKVVESLSSPCRRPYVRNYKSANSRRKRCYWGRRQSRRGSNDAWANNNAENLRFFPEEEANIRALHKLSNLESFTLRRFLCAHRAHSSIDILPRLMLPVVGRSFAELEALDSRLEIRTAR